jgi:tetratricopeptide (TPR) repeat protein
LSLPRFSSRLLPPSLALALGALVLLAGAARAEDRSPDEIARRHHDRGTTFYNLGQFEEAIGEYRKGYEQKADPVFLYNIGQAYRQLGALDRALFFYRRYLSTMPGAPNRAQVEQLVIELDQLVAAQERARTPAPPQPLSGVTAPLPPGATDFDRGYLRGGLRPGPLDDGPIWHRWWFWAGLGTVVAGGLLAGLLIGTSRDSGPRGSDLGAVRFF